MQSHGGNTECGGPWNKNFAQNFIRNALKKWTSISIVHKGRESNMVVDALAKQGIRRDSDFVAWM